MVLNFIVIIRNILYYFRNQKGSQGIVMPIVFAVIMAIAGVLTFGEWFSIFSVAGIVIHTLCMAFSDPQKVRISILATSPMVLVYNIFSVSIGGAVFESVAILSSLIGLIRYLKKSDSVRSGENEEGR